jgi:hypothetical protein
MLKKSVFCIATSVLQANQIVECLMDEGFSNNAISALLPDKTGSPNIAQGIKTPEGATARAGRGAVLGGALGWLVGIDALASPGVGPLVAAGPIVAVLSGAAMGGAAGDIAGALIGLGIPEYEARRFEERIKGGGILISVPTGNSDEVKRVKEIFEQAGAQNIASAGEAGVNYPKAKMTASPYSNPPVR